MPEMKDAEAQSEICPFPMNCGDRCGRPIHPAPEHDRIPVCLMHSKDPAKSDEEFQSEFERILEKAEQTEMEADFSYFVFPDSEYSKRVFLPTCRFDGATFTQNANFRGSYFAQIACFADSNFMQVAGFDQAIFANSAVFVAATFAEYAGFTGARFAGQVSFSGGKFAERACFHSARLCGEVAFCVTGFRHDFTDEHGLDFSNVTVAHPEQVEFYGCDLGQALFYNTDVSKMRFTLVNWRRRGRTMRYKRRRWISRWINVLAFWQKFSFRRGRTLVAWRRRKGSGYICVFDEYANLDDHYELAIPESGGDQRNYSLIAETYQQLKRNYDSKGDYWTAGHWHYGEMEMKRMQSRWRYRPLRWLSHHFSLVALYKYSSAYGESYTMPLAWLAGVLIIFALVYPLVGLELNPHDGWIVDYWNYAEFVRMHTLEHPSRWYSLLLHGFMTSISVAGFQRELRYTPCYPWGRLLALLELLLTTTLGGLFALAIRRQFKRS